MKGVPHISGRAAAAVIIAASLAAYANTFWNGFFWDDDFIILGNRWIRSFANLPEVFTKSAWAFMTDTPTNYYRPLMYAVYMAEYKLFGLNPCGWHLVNALFHAAVSLLVFVTIKAVIGRGSSDEDTSGAVLAALLGAIVFAVHPIHTEAVAWIACAPELLFTGLGLAALYLYASDGMKRYAASVVLFFLALFSKETAVMFLPVIIAFDVSLGRGLRIKRYAPYAAAFAVYFIIRMYAVGGFAPLKRFDMLTGQEYVMNIFPLFAGYIKALALPTGLNLFHVFHPAHSWLEWKVVASLAVTLGYAAAVYLCRGAWRFALLWAAVPLLPVLYIPALGENTFAERYLYAPSAGFALLIALFFLEARRRGISVRIILVVAFLAAAAYSAATVRRNFDWKDSLTLWQDTVLKSPDGPVPHYELGAVLYREGRVKDAAEEFQAALSLEPRYVKAHNDLGVAYKALGRDKEAVEEYLAAIRLDPYYAGPYNNLGIAYYDQGRVEDAIGAFRTALSIRPQFINARENLAFAYASAGRVNEAEAELKEAERLKSGGRIK